MTTSMSMLALYPPALREELFERVLEDPDLPEKYLFYGLDALIRCGVPIKHNLNAAKIKRKHRAITRFYNMLAKWWMGAHGNIEWLLPVWKELKRSPYIFVYSEKCLYPILVLRSAGILPRAKTVLISIGVAEKLQALQKRSLLRERERLLKEFRLLTRIITFSHIEMKILTEEFSLKNVSFIPLGVDTEYFHPGTQERTIDVLGVGGDKNRDFETLILVALQLPEIRFRLVTNERHARKLNAMGIPDNVDMLLNISLAEVAKDMSQCKIVFLPVMENTYSGATTCLLQAMASGRAVVTNPVGPTHRGYGLVHDENVIFVPTGDVEVAVNQIKRLIQEKDIRRDIGFSARKLVEEQLSIDKMINSILLEISHEYKNAFGVDFPCEVKLKQESAEGI